jgi:putative addiction module component (TIGR02574 family)
LVGLGILRLAGYDGKRHGLPITLETGAGCQFFGGWSMDFNTVLTEVDAWPVGDRIRLMNELWDRLVDQGHEPELSEEMKAELDRRLEEDDSAPDDVVPWEEVKIQAHMRVASYMGVSQ